MKAVQPADKAEDIHSICKHIGEDTRLSLNGRGVMLYLITREPGYKLSVPDLIELTGHSRLKSGREAVYATVNELLALGYLSRVRRLGGGMDYTIHASGEVA
jgi:hypothetical protein